MKATITNFRGVSSAEIEIKKITLIAAPNGGGKTSTIQGLAAAMTGNTMPIDGLTKSSSGRLVRGGTASAEITISTDSGKATVIYPEARYDTEGQALTISPISAGIESLCDLDKKSRAQAVSQILKTEPTRDDLINELARNGIGNTDGTASPAVERLLKTIQSLGWDAAHKQAQEQTARLKGQWENETGENYGSKKASGWLPAEWEHDLGNTTAEHLAADLKQERAWWEVAVSDQAVNEAEIHRLSDLAANAPDLTQKIEQQRLAVGALYDTLQKMQRGVRDMPPIQQPQTQPCPHCGKPVSVEGGRVITPRLIGPDEIEARKNAIAETEKSIADTRSEMDRCNKDLVALQHQLQQAEDARKRLEGKKTKKVGTDTRSVDDCRARVARAEARLNAYNRWEKATQIHDSISGNQIVISVLAADGLRQMKLAEALSSFNDMISVLCTAAGWKRIELRQDMGITYGGTPYMLLSKSEKYRCRVTLQATIAGIDNSGIILVDEADILDAVGRNGLFSMLLDCGLGSVVGMTINKRDQVPDLTGMGGISYWIQDGVMSAVGGVS